MKVIHIIKRIEAIDEDIKELRKLEKSLARDKSFSTPIYISIEKQINIMLDDRIKLLNLQISNPPANLLKDMEDIEKEEAVEKKVKPSASVKKAKSRKEKSAPVSSKKNIDLEEIEENDEIEEIEDIGIMTQDLIDERFARLKHEKEMNDRKLAEEDDEDSSDEGIKLLDVALEKGTLNKDSIDKERKKVRFFKDNFPGGEY